MTADEIIDRLHAAGIRHHDVDSIRRGWDVNQSEATDKYLAMDRAGRDEVCRKAVQHVECAFCGAPAGVGCCLTQPHTLSKVLDGYAHCGRWMKYLIDEDLFDMLGEEPKLACTVDDILGRPEWDNIEDML